MRTRTLKLVVIGLALALLAYGAGSFAYLEAFRAERTAGTVVVGVASGFERDAAALARGFVAAGDGRRVVLVNPAGNELYRVESGHEAAGGAAAAGLAGEAPARREPPGPEAAAAEGRNLAGLLESKMVDYVLAGTEALGPLGPWLVPAGEVSFRHADLLAVPFPSVPVAVTLAEAQAIAGAGGVGGVGGVGGAAATAGPSGAASAGAGAGAAPAALTGVEVIGLGDRSPAYQLLEVDGVYPTLKTVNDGTYPLVDEVRVAARRPGGPLGLLGRIPAVGRWSQGGSPAVGEFGEWLASDDARSAFYGAASEITITAVGDIMLGRNVGRDIDAYGLDWPFGLTADRLQAADITFGNLESPLGDTGAPIPGKMIWLRGKPGYVECLKKGGIDVVCLANNHILDYDTPTLLQTIDLLDQNGIAHTGAGKDAAAARVPAIVEAGGLKVAFLGYTEFADSGLFWDFAYRRTFLATDTQAGCNPLDVEMIGEDIARIRPEVDLVVVVFHWGIEDTDYPQPYNPANDLEVIARQTIDLGADVVLGTHPHAVQGYEVYKGRLIAYSLGNFVMDQRRETQKESMILELVAGPSGVLSARVTPCWIDTTRPRVLEGTEAERLLEKLARISVGFRGP